MASSSRIETLASANPLISLHVAEDALREDLLIGKEATSEALAALPPLGGLSMSIWQP
jgi:hypothetical protein